MIIACVDGTGAWKDESYAKVMRNSFVNRIHGRGNGSQDTKQYLRGPTLLGFETGSLALKTADFVRHTLGRTTDRRVCLVGYSRGGAAVIGAAHLLNQSSRLFGIRSVPVDFMILFDAVDRSLTVDASSIPANVKVVYHLRRHVAAGSRESFGNCGTKHSLKTSYTQRFFLCTHGGVGGTPWCAAPGWRGKMGDVIDEGGVDGKTRVSYQQDLVGSTAVWACIEPLLKKNGIVV